MQKKLMAWQVICSMHFAEECFDYHLSYGDVIFALKLRSCPTLNVRTFYFLFLFKK